MKIKTAVAVAVILLLMKSATPYVSEIMLTAFSQYEELANNIVTTDEAGKIELNGKAAEDLLTSMGEGAENVSNTLTKEAEEILNVEGEDLNNWKEKTNPFFEWVKGLTYEMFGKEGE